MTLAYFTVFSCLSPSLHNLSRHLVILVAAILAIVTILGVLVRLLLTFRVILCEVRNKRVIIFVCLHVSESQVQKYSTESKQGGGERVREQQRLSKRAQT